jgi:hypothetical protein
MPDRHHESPPVAPNTDAVQARRDNRRKALARLDEMLRGYWASLVADSEKVAEALLERASQQAASERLATTIP